MNSLEQMCINLTNERLQNHMNQEVIVVERRLYQDEGIPLTDITFNVNTHVVELFTKVSVKVDWFFFQNYQVNVNDAEKKKSYSVLWRKPYTNRKFNNLLVTQKHHQKLRLHNDCGPTGRSVGVTTAIQLMCLHRFIINHIMHFLLTITLLNIYL